jgi:5-oxoprolinase (ATP-hydrolysing) subunit A
MSLRIDLNADLGEGTGNDTEILRYVSSANIACGLHAGDPDSIFATMRQAHSAGVAVGAHPGLFDREGFGRREMPITPDAAGVLVLYQLGAMAALSARAGTALRHIKLHGALYHMATRDAALAIAVCETVVRFDAFLRFYAPSRSVLAEAADCFGLQVVHEYFADRNYTAEGALVPRTEADALVLNADVAVDRVLRMLGEGLVTSIDGIDVPLVAESVCVHGDSPGAVEFAKALRERLEAAGVTITAPS